MQKALKRTKCKLVDMKGLQEKLEGLNAKVVGLKAEVDELKMKMVETNETGVDT